MSVVYFWIKGIVYKACMFFLNNGKTMLVIIVATYMVTTGMTLLAGLGAKSIILPTLNMTLPAL